MDTGTEEAWDYKPRLRCLLAFLHHTHSVYYHVC